MERKIAYETARSLVLEGLSPLAQETVPLEDSFGRVLARDLVAREAVPPFDRAAYDGYALRAADLRTATEETPVVLRVVEEIPAGAVPRYAVVPGTAAKILTGAPIPDGADTVIPYERTVFTADTVTISAPTRDPNIVRAGEDVAPGDMLAPAGSLIDGGLAGTLAGQGIREVPVYCRPRVGILSTGSEIFADEGPLPPGKIRDTNCYTLAALAARMGAVPLLLGHVADDAAAIAGAVAAGLEQADLLMLTGGVSVGDYDLTPQAMEMIGSRLLFRGVALKPGMACAFGRRDGKLICGLSGNPASALTAFHVLVAPALRRLAGWRAWLPETFPVELAVAFPKASRSTRMLRGRLDLSGGRVVFYPNGGQGNAVLHSAVGVTAMAEIPAGSGPVEAGTVLRGFLL